MEPLSYRPNHHNFVAGKAIIGKVYFPIFVRENFINTMRSVIILR